MDPRRTPEDVLDLALHLLSPPLLTGTRAVRQARDVDTALVEEATRRSAVLWVRGADGREQALWHLWHLGAAYVVTGGLEQPCPGGDGRVVVIVRSRERQAGQVVRWEAVVEQLVPGSPRWEEVVPLLHAQRLNAPDGQRQPERWARESRVLRLLPDEAPDAARPGDAAG